MPRNGAKKKMKELGVTVTSGGRAFRHFAIASATSLRCGGRLWRGFNP
ncbi:hypothetical protein [uncultured Treponema sp.]|nr:hypothetical protein [uncultured Treponema sp.]